MFLISNQINSHVQLKKTLINKEDNLNFKKGKQEQMA